MEEGFAIMQNALDQLRLDTTKHMSERSGEDLDLDTLRRDFSIICDDFETEITEGSKLKAVEFCSKVIYEIGPEFRRFKKNDGDKVWKMRFPYKINNVFMMKTVFIVTHFTTYKHTTEENKMILTIKEAGLLAMITFNKLVIWALNRTIPVILLTPLAASIFPKSEIPKIADELGISLEDAVLMVNSSCQPGGENLIESTGYCAVAASICATRGLKDKNVQRSIITKTIKQYMLKKKFGTLDKDLIIKVAKYAPGGLPPGFTADDFIKLAEKIQADALSGKAMAAVVEK